MNLNDLLKQLEERNYKVKYQDIFDGEVIGLDLYNEANNHIHLHTGYNKEYMEELSKLPVGTEYEVDYSRMECTGAFFECCIDYPEGAADSSHHGISLYENNLEYCGLDYFWKAFEAFENPTAHSIVVMKAHIEHISYFNDILRPILCKYDFINDYDTFFDSTTKAYLGSTPTFTYKYIYSFDEDIYFRTDPISLEFKGTINPYSTNFEEELRKWMCYKDDGSARECFKRFFTNDITYTPTSHKDILAVLSSISSMKGERFSYFYPPEKINFNNIPISKGEIIEEYYKLYNSRKSEKI